MKIERIASKVLETGRVSNLINYLPTKGMTSSYVVNDDIVSLFNCLQKGERMVISSNDSKNTNNLCLDISKDDLKTKIRKLYDQNNTVKTEQGVQCLYVVFGFLKWLDNQNKEYNAPLIMMPVDIARKNKASNLCYEIYKSDEEIIINKSLLFKIKSEKLDLNIPEINGLTLNEFFDKFEDSIHNSSFKLNKKSAFGIFYDKNISIYQDLMSNKEKVENHPFVLALNGEQEHIVPLNVASDKIEDNDLSYYDNHTVVSADASQLKAIKEALNGKSMIVEGPPGTGKSQTITNIISELIHSGKTVLFVAQKAPALQVVAENLKRVNLDDYSLFLANDKVKKTIYQSLNDTLLKNATKIKDEPKELFDSLDESKENFKNYHKDLHTVNEDINQSLYEVINHYVKYMNYDNASSHIDNPIDLDKKELNERLVCLDNINNYLNELNIKDYRNHYLFKLKKDKNNKDKIKALVDDLVNNTKELSDLFMDLNVDQIYTLLEFKNTPLNCLNPLNFNKTKLDNVIVLFSNYNKVVGDINNKKDEVLLDFHKDVLLEKVIKSLYKIPSKLEVDTIKKYKKELKLNKKLLKNYLINKHTKLTNELIFAYTNILNEILLLSNEELNAKNTIYSTLNIDVNNDLNLVNNDVNRLNSLYNQFDYLKDEHLNYLGLELTDGDQALFKWIKNYKNQIEELNSYYDEGKANLVVYPYSKHLDILLDMQGSFLTSNIYLLLIEELNKYKDTNIVEFINEVLEKGLNREYFKEIYLKDYYLLLIDILKERYPSLKNYSMLKRNLENDNYSEKDDLFYIYSIAKIREVVSNRMPNPNNQSTKSDIGILKSQSEKPTLPIKEMFKKIKRLLPRIKPIMLMSPLAVSTYLPSDYEFDVVIFDEASQILVEDALCAIYRSKQVIVVGDSEQMPPTNFFKKLNDNNDDDDEENTVNGESLLEVCHSFLDSIKLKWHYRSRYEDLINFSNKHIYKNDLITFPAAKSGEVDTGLEFIYVEEGIYDRGGKRTNPIEASKVVELIINHIDNHSERSLGVVSFSIVQRDEILKQLDKEVKNLKDTNKSLYDKVINFINDEERKETFFVKNLENVQGDERDTIILSICYGKDKEKGELFCNLGKLTSDEGRKRINVAVSRSKVNMKVVCSFDPKELKIDNEDQKGLIALKNFLLYAKNKEEDDKVFEETKDALVLDIYNELKEKGYGVNINVGKSKFKVDLGVLNNDNDQEYILGICVDGDSYKNCSSIRDREKLRKAVLTNLGWNIINVWSCDYYNNKEFVINKIINEIEHPSKKSKVKQTLLLQDIEATKLNSEMVFRDYIKADYNSIINSKIRAEYNDLFKEVVLEVLKIEGPIHLYDLSERVCRLFNVDRVNEQVLVLVSERLKRSAFKDIVECDSHFYYLKNNKTYNFRKATFKRSVTRIYKLELIDLIYKIIFNSSGIDEKFLYKQIRRHCNYKENEEFSVNEKTYLDSIVRVIINVGLIEKENDLYYIKRR